MPSHQAFAHERQILSFIHAHGDKYVIACPSTFDSQKYTDMTPSLFEKHSEAGAKIMTKTFEAEMASLNLDTEKKLLVIEVCSSPSPLLEVLLT